MDVWLEPSEDSCVLISKPCAIPSLFNVILQTSCPFHSPNPTALSLSRLHRLTNLPAAFCPPSPPQRINDNRFDRKPSTRPPPPPHFPRTAYPSAAPSHSTPVHNPSLLRPTHPRPLHPSIDRSAARAKNGRPITRPMINPPLPPLYPPTWPDAQ